MRKVHYLLQLGKLAINNVKFRISASKFFLTRFPQQVLFARVYGKRLTFFLPRSLVQKLVMPVFGQGKSVRVYGRQGKTIMVLANKTPS
jgi:hypothetical protein